MEHRPDTNACQEFEALLEDVLEGKAASTDSQHASSHMETCDSCRTAFANASKMGSFLRNSLEPAEAPDAGFARRTMAAIRLQEKAIEEESRFWKPLEVLAWRVALSAALAVVLLLAYARTSSVITPSQVEVMARQTAEPELFNDPGRMPITGDDVFVMTTDKKHGK
jgi:anti-sigma factor RsiW